MPAPDTPPLEDRDRERIVRFWDRMAAGLVWYAKHSAARLLGCINLEGFYLFGALVALLVLTWVASLDLPWWFGIALAAVAAGYVLDSLLVNTSIVFVTHAPIYRLRSILLTVLNVINVGVAFGGIYAIEGNCFNTKVGFVEALYFSFVTLSTVGYGEIHPKGACAWLAQLTIVCELLAGLYFLAVVLTVVTSWARRPESEHRYYKGPPSK